MGRGENTPAIRLGRYEVFDEIASGGMASVHIGRLLGPSGFSRTVAIKRLHDPFARDPHFASRFLEEAHLAARVHHPNVVSITDVVEHDGEIALIMDFVLGETLATLLGALSSQGHAIPAPIASGILVPVLHGLHAAHETRGDDGRLLGLVHRDVSPQNILVGADGVCRVVDFGIAKAAAQDGDRTQDGILKGKIGYLAPEQLRGQEVDRRVDVFAAGVVLWEMLAGQRLFKSSSPEEGILKILEQVVVPPSRSSPNVSPALDSVTLQALAQDPDVRFATAADMAVELERCSPPASSTQIASWMNSIAGDRVSTLRDRVSKVESSPIVRTSKPSEPPAKTPPPDQPSPGKQETIQDAVTASGASGRLIFLFSICIAIVLLGGFGAWHFWHFSTTESAPVTSNLPASNPSPMAASGSTPSTSHAQENLDRVTSIVSGPAARFTCALRNDNSVWCWGDNEAGQIGHGGRADALHALRVEKLEPTVEVATGNRHACAILGDTRVACWGNDLFDRPTLVMGLSDVLHVRCGGRHSCLSRNDGRVLCWGENDRGQLGTSTTVEALTATVEGLAPAKQISTGTNHACAVVNGDSSVWCWGDNVYGQLGQGTTDREPHPRPIRVPGLPPSVQVEAGDKTTFVRTRDGHVYGWGFGIKRPVRLQIERVVSLAAGGKQNCALDADGAIWCWGFNDFGQLGGATPGDSATPVRVGSLTGAKGLAAGDVHVCALVDGGEVACWGSNEHGQLGIGTKDRGRHPEPRRVLSGVWE